MATQRTGKRGKPQAAPHRKGAGTGKPPTDQMGWHYEVQPSGHLKLVVTDLKKTQNLPPPPPTFEGIRIENGKPKFYFCEKSRQQNREHATARPAPTIAEQTKPEQKVHGIQRAWDTLTPYEKKWVAAVTGRDGPDPAGSKTTTAPGTKPIAIQNDTPVAAKATEGDGGGRRYSVFGHNVTSVLRWMGADAWTFEQAKKAMTKLGLPVADATLRAQLRAGVIGTRGDPAKLTDEQIENLYSLIEDVPCPTTKTASPTTSRSAPGAVPPKPPTSSRSTKSSSASASAKTSTVSKSKTRKKSKSGKSTRTGSGRR